MNEMNGNEDALLSINHLLEQLHQAGYHQIGSLVFVAPGAQYVKTIQTQNVTASPNLVKGVRADRTLPESLATEKAMALWQRVQEAGYVDERYQPTISRAQSALLADAMAERLAISEKWKVFGELWGRKYMYNDYYRAVGQHQFHYFQDRLKKLLG